MYWFIIIALIVLLLCWLLVVPVVLEVDTCVPFASMRWGKFAGAVIWYDEAWRFSFRMFFFKKTMPFSEMKRRPGKAAKSTHKKARPAKKNNLKKIVAIIKACEVKEWRLAIDTGDIVLNGQLFALNFLPVCYQHVAINFTGESYAYLKLQYQPWKIVYALLH
ncbi:hypothetical protein QWZ08_06545 [Ferruginibacter paludis]|uniref:hypothetical protein n=1 Tax=Ferruginibacter paludis TaxID=1310417 RepID=UPI0025B3D356|nr:hypothetical protein [Ferruginibacter paludis]MDN3655273.1 hypothetical protein [Ferruginibacter paludis]